MELIEELEDTNTPILAIVSDWLMPGIKGDEFLIRVHQRYPHIIKVLLAGQADDAVIERANIEANLHNCLHKPWQGRKLIETMNSGLANL
jgi:CheY-like chemotaxis protein